MKPVIYRKAWNIYQSSLKDGLVAEGARAVFHKNGGGSLALFNEAAAHDDTVLNMKLAVLLGVSPDNKNDFDEMIRTKDYKIFELGMEFIDATRKADIDRVAEIAESGFNVNFVHPIHGVSALHTIAFAGSRSMLRAFLQAEKINYLQTDDEGRLPSALAAKNRDRVMERFLRIKERQQAAANGIDYDHLTQG